MGLQRWEKGQNPRDAELFVRARRTLGHRSHMRSDSMPAVNSARLDGRSSGPWSFPRCSLRPAGFSRASLPFLVAALFLAAGLLAPSARAEEWTKSYTVSGRAKVRVS